MTLYAVAEPSIAKIFVPQMLAVGTASVECTELLIGEPPESPWDEASTDITVHKCNVVPGLMHRHPGTT